MESGLAGNPAESQNEPRPLQIPPHTIRFGLASVHLDFEIHRVEAPLGPELQI
jgi:hypothetical protein